MRLGEIEGSRTIPQEHLRRVCLLADFPGPLDEGMRKTAYHLSRQLSERNEVKCWSLGRAFLRGSWREIRAFQPQVIHYVPGPSILSFMAMKVLKAYCRNSKTVISASHPSFYGLKGFRYGPYYALSSLLKGLIPLLKPDMLLVQSSETEEMFKKMGCRTELLPSGVDTERFAPATLEARNRLREKWGLDQEEFVVFHAGSFRKWRGVGVLAGLQTDQTRVIVLGSSTRVESETYRDLERSGCLVYKEYVENVEELYKLADCYVFPTTDVRGSIEMPLSVLEAMATNLPVVSTKFGALPGMFECGGGLILVDSEQELLEAVRRVKEESMEVRTREKVMAYSWENIASRLEEIYTAAIDVSVN